MQSSDYLIAYPNLTYEGIMSDSKTTEAQAFHFFASSAFDWRTHDSIAECIARMNKLGYTFNLWYVPVAGTSAYQINGYAPMVDGAIFLGTFKGKKG